MCIHGVKVGHLSWETSRGERPVTARQWKDRRSSLRHYSASTSPLPSYHRLHQAHSSWPLAPTQNYIHCVVLQPRSRKTRLGERTSINARADSVSTPELFSLHHLLLCLYCKVTRGGSHSISLSEHVLLTARRYTHTDTVRLFIIKPFCWPCSHGLERSGST